MKPTLSIIYIYYNTPKELTGSLASISKAVGKISHEIIIVDNNSSVEIPSSILKNKKCKVLHLNNNIGYGGGANRGVAVAGGEYVLIANPDITFHTLSISKMIGAILQDKKIGLLGPKYLDSNSNVLPSVSGYPTLPGAIAAFSLFDKFFPGNHFSKVYWMRDFNYEREKSVSVVGGACMLFRKNAFEKVKGFDEKYFMYFEEADISYRIKKAGYKVLYFPSAMITHLIGRSTIGHKDTQQKYEKSRFTFFSKQHGFIKAMFGEAIIRLLQPNTLTLLFIIALSLFLNTYQINKYTMFYGDFGRDLLVARDMLVTGNIPLLGIPSSVVWLHQGPLSIYLMSIALFFGKMSPVAPALLYALMGVASTFMTYILGKQFFNEKIGLLAAALYATSPIIVMNAREPYHTAPIPFFTLLFFLSFWRVINKDTRFVFITFFFLGLLLQLELSNVVIVVLLAVAWWYYRLSITKNIILQGIAGFLLGIVPFILYDLTHRFIQIGGLALWTLNRIRLFFGLTTSGNATTYEAGNALMTMWAEIVRVIYPLSPTIVALVVVGVFLLFVFNIRTLLSRKVPSGLLLLGLWLGIAIVGYAVHAKPGSAYFPVLYPAIVLVSAYAMYMIYKKIPIIIFFVAIMIGFNAYYLLINNYFLVTPNSTTIPNLYGYHYGLSLEVQEHAVDSIIDDAQGKPFSIQGGGFLRDFTTSVDNYIYLALWKGGRIEKNAKTNYIIYQGENENPKGNIIYQNIFLVVIKQ